ncbi:MAG TPA: type 1 glutamine amidotransferase [Paenalcaligenes hominis]|uniref:Type 1 glutamine amidotransferase n=1 Tax=Paenalcaligenes hominis TaxID=643674 RepID=A0A9D3AB27_9BURK|nr:type 1 glutamine amidotransferase [Paenalcaligenes hominis]
MATSSKPVLIIQHTTVGHPGAVLSILDELNVTWDLVALNQGDTLPTAITPYSGLILMGGRMSANDDLEWIHTEMGLVQQARAQGVPIAGHCLGSQIMSKALGAQIKKNAYKEIGWQPINAVALDKVQDWFGAFAEPCFVFQWHGDTFSLPEGAELLLSSEACVNQAYVIDDKHIAMQFHLEMTPLLITVSVESNGNELEKEQAAGNKYVSTKQAIVNDTPRYLPPMHAMLRCVYTRWVKNLKLSPQK